MKKYFILLALALVTLVSCDKNEPGETPEKEYDVYVIGDEVGGYVQTKPTYWKNGEKVTLQTNGEGYINAIFVSNNNVYVAGDDRHVDHIYRAVYWENGKLIELQDDNSDRTSATSLCVVGSDVYVGGMLTQKEATFQRNHTVYWKNGVLVYLKGGFSEAKSICVVGDDVYVLDEKGYWKNGIRTELPFSVDQENIHASDMKVVGNDVYIAGCEEVNDNGKESHIALYWKNGNPVILSDQAEAYSIYISDNDVYAAGVDKINDRYRRLERTNKYQNATFVAWM